MARIGFGLATSHGPMLSVPWKNWVDRVAFDKTAKHFYKGQTYSFDEIVALRSTQNLTAQLTAEVCESRHARCQAAIRRLGDVFIERKPDVAVIVGNDQMEIFTPDHVPAFAIFWGPYVEGHPRTQEFLNSLPPGIAEA